MMGTERERESEGYSECLVSLLLEGEKPRRKGGGGGGGDREMWRIWKYIWKVCKYAIVEVCKESFKLAVCKRRDRPEQVWGCYGMWYVCFSVCISHFL